MAGQAAATRREPSRTYLEENVAVLKVNLTVDELAHLD
jgi:hypothetical protein